MTRFWYIKLVGAPPPLGFGTSAKKVLPMHLFEFHAIRVWHDEVSLCVAFADRLRSMTTISPYSDPRSRPSKRWRTRRTYTFLKPNADSGGNVPIAFPFKAAVFPGKNGPFHAARTLAERIRDQIPSATVDWQAGERKVQDDLQQLVALKAPTMIIDQHVRFRSLQYAEVKVSYKEWPGRTVVGYVGNDDPDMAGSTFEIVGDFNVDLLKRAAADLSAANASYQYCFICKNQGLDTDVYPDSFTDATEYVHYRRSTFKVNGHALLIEPLGDWEGVLVRAVTGWLNGAKYGEEWGVSYENVLRGFSSADAFAHAALREISEIGAVRRAWSFESPYYHFGILFEQVDNAKRSWATMIELLGVAKASLKR
jgi:hypothetical protein